MEPVLSKDFQDKFYTLDGVEWEKVAEKAFHNLCRQVCPNIDIEKKKIYKGTPDGILTFKDRWIPVEVKRDVGPSPEMLASMLLQDMMTAGHFLYNLNPYRGRFNFGGLILTSMQFFVYIPREEVEKIIDEFEPLWTKYKSIIAPNEAFGKIPELAVWARQAIRKLNYEIHHFVNNFRFDKVLDEILNPKN